MHSGFMQIIKALSIIFFVGLWSTTVLAVPNPSGVTGNVSDGSNIVISGSGFGSGPNVLIFDDFESGTVGQDINTGAGSAKYGQWALHGASCYYGSWAAVSGSKSFETDYSVSSFNHLQVSVPAGSQDELFISWWLYIPAGYPVPGEGLAVGRNWKQMWVQGSGTADDDIVVPTFHSSWQINGNDGVYGKYINNINFQRGKWKRLWTYMVTSTDKNTNDGTLQLWELEDSGVDVLANDVGVPTVRAGGKWERVRFNGWGRETPNTYSMFDDTYVAAGPNARARVEVGNASTYNASTKLTIFTPISWSASSITAQVNLGNFSAGQTAYLYVFDGNGVANSTGIPITIGQPVSSDPPDIFNIDTGSPNPSGTTSADIEFTATDSDGVTGCKDSPTSGVAYDSMPNTYTKSGNDFSRTVTGLTNGSSTTFYIKCRDTLGYTTSDYSATIDVEASSGDCDSDRSLCSTQSTCLASADSPTFWNPRLVIPCIATDPGLTCGVSALDFCYTENICTTAELYWRDGACKSTLEPTSWVSEEANRITQSDVSLAGSFSGWQQWGTGFQRLHSGVRLYDNTGISNQILIDNTKMVCEVNLIDVSAGQFEFYAEPISTERAVVGTQTFLVDPGVIVDHSAYLKADDVNSDILINHIACRLYRDVADQTAAVKGSGSSATKGGGSATKTGS